MAVGGALGAGAAHRAVAHDGVAVAHRQQPALNEHRQVQRTALDQFLYVNVAAVGAAVAGRLLRVSGRGGHQPN